MKYFFAFLFTCLFYKALLVRLVNIVSTFTEYFVLVGLQPKLQYIGVPQLRRQHLAVYLENELSTICRKKS